ncbi:MAG: asparagine synthase (glutamine-hydrolyzing) [Acidobacteriota bacterium]
MCGIAGLYGPGASRPVIEAMTRSLRHRGPDGDGVFVDGDLMLGHTRLSIIDLETGDQPMTSADGRYVMVYNGEIYNFRDLRRRLEEDGRVFRTESDSEVILEGFCAWGTDVFARLDGMFAIALWDCRRRRLVLARDLFGIKPVHYLETGDTLRFASEIKALLQDPAVERRVDFQSMHHLLNLRFIPGERTLFDGVRRLPPGHLLVFENGRSQLRPFATLEPASEGPGGRRAVGDYAEGVRHYLRAAVTKQLVSDVPLGVSLSGGLDSSSLVAFMAESTSSIQTFSLGFGEPTDELEDARVVAEHFGTEHHEITLDAEPLRHYPSVIWAAEEPKENTLQGYLLSAFARRRVKAVLGGLGGDELFAGYTIHRFISGAAPIHGLIPGVLRRALMAPWSRALFRLQDRPAWRRFDQYRRGLQLGLSLGDPCGYYSIVRNVWDGDPRAWNRYGPAWDGVDVEPTRSAIEPFFAGGMHPLRQVLETELRTKMVNDFLLNEDRTSMAHSLEVRVPFLDRDLVRYAREIPVDLLAPGRETKALFRRAMGGLLPAHTLGKKKWGFTVDPYHQFQKDLRSTARRVLSPERVARRGWFDPAYLQSIVDHPPHPRMRWHYFFLWLALGLEIWARLFLEGDVSSPQLDLEGYA